MNAKNLNKIIKIVLLFMLMIVCPLIGAGVIETLLALILVMFVNWGEIACDVLKLEKE